MARSQIRWQEPQVVFQPQVYESVQRGIKQIVQAILPTYGPLPRLVISESTISPNHRPEILDDGATIARRVIQIRGRNEDVGAMYLRHALWRVHETAGDGTAATAILFDTIFGEGVKYIAAGGNAMRLRRQLDKCCALVLEELNKQVVHLTGKQALARLAEVISYDPELSKLLGDIFDTIGEYGRLEIQRGIGQGLERVHIEGMYWDGGLLSRYMANDSKTGSAQLEDSAIYISDLSIKEPEDLIPVLQSAIQAGRKSLLLVAAEVTDRALALLLNPANRERITVVAVKSPSLNAEWRREALQDLAILSGGKAFFAAAGDTTRLVKSTDLGFARRAWATRTDFGILGGQGSPQGIRQHINLLKVAFQNAGDHEQRKHLRERIGKLIGGTAILSIGGATPLDVESRLALAERTAEAMRGALRSGVVPGGGVALFCCRENLEQKVLQAQDPDERAAYQIVAKALSAPLWALLKNCGCDPAHVIGEIYNAGGDFGYDVLAGRVMSMKQAGIYDSAVVVKTAIATAIHAASLALSIDVVVHSANPPVRLQTA